AAALTMNAGMVRLVEVLQLKDGALSDEERSAVRRHPSEGAELLRRAGVTDEDWLAYVLMHHETEDGSGYPAGRRDVPENARLVGLADRYCALVSARNYRRSLLPPQACRKLLADCGDDPLAPHLARTVGFYPAGTLVRLHGGEVGVVSCGQGPVVHALRDAAGKRLAPPMARDAREPQYAIDAALHEDDARLRFSMRQVWGAAAAV
ncbi:MAG: HD-GYP domain-containing protein, partial [Telluria sp.]